MELSALFVDLAYFSKIYSFTSNGIIWMFLYSVKNGKGYTSFIDAITPAN